MECLRTTSPALEQLSPNKDLMRHRHKTGRKTHLAHRLSNALVTLPFASNQWAASAVYRRYHHRSSKNSRPAVDATISFTRSIGALQYDLLVGCAFVPFGKLPWLFLCFIPQT